MANATRKLYGIAEKPLQATRVLIKQMPVADAQKHFKQDDVAILLVINDNTGKFCNANTYSGNLGKNFTPVWHPLPAKDDVKWKGWDKDGYAEADVEDFKALELVEATVDA